MAEEHPLALSLVSQGSPGTTVAPDRQATIDAERARRQTMPGLYAELGALLPNLSPRVRSFVRVLNRLFFFVILFFFLLALIHCDREIIAQASRAQIVEDAIAYVRALRDTAAELEAYRAVAAGRSHAAARDGQVRAEVVASGETSSFAVWLRAARRGALTRVLEVFHRHGVAVLAATVARNGGEAAVTVTTAAVEPGLVEMIKADIVSIV